MKRRHEQPAVVDPEKPGPEEKAETPPAPPEEPKGLEGVDAAPLPAPSREDIEALRRERDELRDQLLRKRADFENYRKRVDRDRHQAGIDMAASILQTLIPTIDNLERALQAGGDETSLREGVGLTLRDLLSTLEGHGVVTQDPTGQRFDPQIHQALCHEAAPGFEEGTVVEVLRKGYFFKDRLLRPALVKVAKGQDGTQDRNEPEAIH